MSLTGAMLTVAGVCGMSGSLTLYSVLSVAFDVTGRTSLQRYLYDHVTDLFGTAARGRVDLTGTMEQEGWRTYRHDTGPGYAVTHFAKRHLLGDAMTMTLDPISSFGATSIAADGGRQLPDVGVFQHIR